MKNVIQRCLTGIIYVALIGLGIITNSYTFLVLFTVITFLCLYEFYGLLNKQKNAGINLWYNSIGGILLFVSTYFFASGLTSYFVFFVYLLYIIASLIGELYTKKNDPIQHVAYLFLGQIYIALPVSLLNFIAFSETVYFPTMILALFVFIWINDTGAYCIGVLFGKHRLFERISPKKSWEGFFGGLLFTIASSFIFFQLYPETPCYHWVGLAVGVVVLGTFGDLIESLMKRTLGVKDSGNTIPGHGGFLDRFDSFLLAIYAVLIYSCLIIQS